MASARKYDDFEPERLVKSSQRVRDLGEVFTPAQTVDEMLDLFPEEVWSVHPAKTMLEPSVGNGNFVSAILSRKLTIVDEALEVGKLPAGNDQRAAEFHALEALSSIYGVDISEENIIGGTPGHEVACRPRLLDIMSNWHIKILGSEARENSSFLLAAKWIVDHNMIIGNMLAKDSEGRLTGRELMPIVTYTWLPETMGVELGLTTLGDIMATAEEESSDVLSLFGSMPPEPLWSGQFDGIHEAQNQAQLILTGKRTSNSRGSK